MEYKFDKRGQNTWTPRHQGCKPLPCLPQGHFEVVGGGEGYISSGPVQAQECSRM